MKKGGFKRYFIYKNSKLDFEKKVLSYTCIILSIAAFLGGIISAMLNLDKATLFISFGMSIFFFVLYIVDNRYNFGKTIQWIVSISMLFIININWLFNYGSSGPSIFMFIVYISFIVFIWDRKYIIIFTTLSFINVLGLYSIELLHPDILTLYQSESARISDNYFTLILCMIVIFSYTFAAKKFYIQQYQEIKKTDNLKTTFISNMSHEIRTPLNAIVGFSKLSQKKNLPEAKKSEFFKMVNTNSDYLSTLIEDILDISKIETNQLDVQYQKFDIPELFKKLFQEYSCLLEEMDEKNIKLSYKTPADSKMFTSDVRKVEKIFRNLLDNAFKFTTEGEIEFGYFKDKGLHFFYVKDTGMGIKREYITRIFDRFVKIDDDDRKLFRGTGIGLFYTKQLITLLKGEIWVESEYQKGSRFSFILPEQRIPLSKRYSSFLKN